MSDSSSSTRDNADRLTSDLLHQLTTLILTAACCLLSIGTYDKAISAEKGGVPNIVLILADDLGWTDLGFMGSQYYETPNIDRLADQGMRFNSYYVCQNCAPTRAALMSGQYAPRTGVYTVSSFERGKDADRKMIPPKNLTDLPLEKFTIAQALQAAGYVTGMFGKWHLGQGAEYHPSQRGFDEAIITGRGHFKFTTTPPVDVPQGQYHADFVTDRAIDFIDRYQAERFFLYLPHFAVHTPIEAKEELIEKYRDKEPVGGHNDPVYAAMIHSVDESVGRIMDKLDEFKLVENTVVVFTSDNGGVGGYQVPGTKRTKGITDNAPLRGGKGTLYEGGVRVPLIVRWPQEIEPGTTCDEPVVHIDFYPTFLELAEAEPKPDYPLDGLSMTPLFENPAANLGREAIYFHFPGYLEAYIDEAVWRTTPVSTIRMGDWKLMEFFEDDRLELYNLNDDLGETTNLAETMPQRANMLHQKLTAWREKTNAEMPRFKETLE